MLWAVAVGPPFAGWSPTIFFSPSVISLIVWRFNGCPAFFWACAVGPPSIGWSLPVSFVSASVILEMVSELSVAAILVVEVDRGWTRMAWGDSLVNTLDVLDKKDVILMNCKLADRYVSFDCEKIEHKIIKFHDIRRSYTIVNPYHFQPGAFWHLNIVTTCKERSQLVLALTSHAHQPEDGTSMCWDDFWIIQWRHDSTTWCCLHWSVHGLLFRLIEPHLDILPFTVCTFCTVCIRCDHDDNERVVDVSMFRCSSNGDWSALNRMTDKIWAIQDP